MAGLTKEGWVAKRLPEVLTDLRTEAVNRFQDLLVDPNDVVDTTPSTALGRLIGLVSPSISDLWEAAQQVYLAFDPNSATGIALDNLVSYGGLTRNPPTYSVASLLLTGEINTTIPSGSVVKAADTNNEFSTLSGVTLNAMSASGLVLKIGTVANATTYTLSYTLNSNTSTVSYTSLSTGATEANILAGIKALIDSAHPALTASIFSNTLTVDKANVFSPSNFTNSANLTILSYKKIVSARASVGGAVNQEANTITNIATPILGWSAVTNPVAAVPGDTEETDDELRERFRLAKFQRSTNITDSLYSVLGSVEAVAHVSIKENETSTTDADGIPAHSFMPIVLGGADAEVAEAIWKNKPFGIRTYGNTTVAVADSTGTMHNINFERPNPVVIYVEMTLKVDSAVFPGDGDEQIKQEIINNTATTLSVGDDVIYSRLYSPINAVAGHYVVDLKIGTNPAALATTNIAIAFNQIASFSATNITVTLT